MNLIVSSLFIELALLLLPGFIWMKIQRAYGDKREQSQFDAILNAFIYSIISYIVLAAIYWKEGWQLKITTISTDAKQLIQSDVVPEILSALGISIILSIIWLYASKFKIFSKILRIIRATNTYGDEDVWDYTFNSSSKLTSFLHFRDFEERVVYAGDVKVFSESEKLRELTLEDVAVYDFDGHELYRIPALYLSRAPDKLHIEFPGDQGPIVRARDDALSQPQEQSIWQTITNVPIVRHPALLVMALFVPTALLVGRQLVKDRSERVD